MNISVHCKRLELSSLGKFDGEADARLAEIPLQSACSSLWNWNVFTDSSQSTWVEGWVVYGNPLLSDRIII